MPQIPIQRPILNRLHHMLRLDGLLRRKIRNRPGYLQNPIIRAGREVQFLHGMPQQFLTGGVETAVGL